jgi:hypothetical protein
MSKKIPAFLIDPFARTITEVVYNDDFTQILKLIDADSFDGVRVNDERDTLYVDDEGLFKSNQKFFKLSVYPQPLAGKALLLGTDHRGEAVAPKCTLDWVKSNVLFDVVVNQERVLKEAAPRVIVMSDDPKDVIDALFGGDAAVEQEDKDALHRQAYLNEMARKIDAHIETLPSSPDESPTPTPYAVSCYGSCIGPEENEPRRIYMTEKAYLQQMRSSSSQWCCPRCGGRATFDDRNFERRLEEEEQNNEQQD